MTTTELHAAIAQMQVLIGQAADRIAHFADELAKSHTVDGIVKDLDVQLTLESDADLIDHLRAAALPWDQRHKPDPYASEAETLALLMPDTRTAAERNLAQMMAERGADEQGAEAYPILRQIALELLAEQPAQPQQEPTDSMGMPVSCGKPLCSPGDHHPLCKLAEQPAQPQEACPTCGEYEPKTGTCGTSPNDKRALCNRNAPQAHQQETINGRTVKVDWKAQALELRELVRLGGIKIAELEAELAGKPAQQEPVAPTAVEMQNAAANLALMREMWGNSDEPAAKVNDDGFIVETGLLLSPGTQLYTSSPAQRKPLTPEKIAKGFQAQSERFSLLPRLEAFKAGVRFAEAAHNIKENT